MNYRRSVCLQAAGDSTTTLGQGWPKLWRVIAMPLVAACVSLLAGLASASSAFPSLELSALARSADLLPIGELAPKAIATPGVSATIGTKVVVLGLEPWAGASAGGSWQHLLGTGYKARFSYVHWTVSAGLRRAIWENRSARLTGSAYFEYGEANSWLENLLLARAGPETIHSGGGVRLTTEGSLRWVVRPTLGLEYGVYRAHATEPATATAVTWIGGSSGLTLGLKYGP